MCHLAVPLTPAPVRLSIDAPAGYRGTILGAMNEWNAFAGWTLFEQSSEAESTARVEPGPRLWVLMQGMNGNTKPILYTGADANLLAYWAVHELGHVLGFGDHLHPASDMTGYVNPNCTTHPGYEGVMSYMTPRELWLHTADDRRMLDAAYTRPPLIRRAFVPGLSA